MNNSLRFLHLEVLARTPEEAPRSTPLVFVHGAYVGAWCWDEHFLPFFAERGYASYALSLRGHGASAGYERLHWLSLRDYVADLEQLVATLPQPPVLIGHSMGGLVIQKFLEHHSAAAVVLLASVPPTGLLEMNCWLALTRPQLLRELWLLQAGAYEYVDRSEVARALFSPHLCPHRSRDYLGRTQSESTRALLDMSGWDLPSRPRHRPPALVLGAGGDALVPGFSVHTTAAAFGTEAEILPDLAHAMMLEPAWTRVAGRIDEWLSAL